VHGGFEFELGNGFAQHFVDGGETRGWGAVAEQRLTGVEFEIDHRADGPRELRRIFRELGRRAGVVVECVHGAHDALEVGRDFVGGDGECDGWCVGHVRYRDHVGHVVGRIVLDKLLEREPFAPHHDDVAPTVGKQVHFGDFGDAADAARRQCALGDTWHAAQNPKARVAVPHVCEHLPVPRLEEMQRDRRSREQHHAQRKDRESLHPLRDLPECGNAFELESM
jgi:hypothetical protein